MSLPNASPPPSKNKKRVGPKRPMNYRRAQRIREAIYALLATIVTFVGLWFVSGKLG